MKENHSSEYNEITLKELITVLQGYIMEIIRSWWIILLVSLICIAGFVYSHSKVIPTYKAELRFVVEGQSGGGGGLSSLLGSIGIKKGGKVNPFKIIEVGKSTNLLNKTLSHSISNGTNIANSILQVYDLQTEWGDDYSSFLFQDTLDVSGAELHRNAIKKIRSLIWGSESTESLTGLSLDEETGVYTLVTQSISEELSLALTNTLYSEIRNFFEEEVFRNQKQLADILEIKADSIRLLNESKIKQLARFQDTNRGIVSNEAMVTKTILTQETFALNSAYAEIMKNKEMTDVNLQDMQPLFMAIDTPFGPISPSSSSLITAIIKGLLLGMFISVFYILSIKIYRDVMSN